MLHTLLIILAVYEVIWIILANCWLLILVLAGIVATILGIILLYLLAPACLGGGIFVLVVLGAITAFASEMGWIDLSEGE